MKKLQYMLLVAGLMMAGLTNVMAQGTAVPAANIRYVKTETAGGKYTNDGTSWEQAKNNIQDAIQSLVSKNAIPGEVWVAAGTYRPTQSTESAGGSTLYMSFQIPAGITVRGGFPEDGKLKHTCAKAGDDGWELGSDSTYITDPAQRPMVNYSEVGPYFYFQTILTGDLSSSLSADFKWNAARKQYNTTFYGNCYHVVTFATRGFHPDGHAKALDTSRGEAMLEGMIVEHGNAQYHGTESHPHEAYGGGIYMVKGSRVEKTLVRECEASRNGGGIYMDGGGFAEHIYVSKCQALGVGTSYGYGGGVCLEDGTYASSDPTKGMYPTVLTRSGITSCVARNGGGVSVYCNNTQYKNRLALSSVLVGNNVAQNEAGGVYLYQGGAAMQMTVVNNECLGSGIAVNGIVNGRSGGVYVRDFANIANSVFWGNKCETNRDVQFASSRSDNEEAKKPIVRCAMLSKSDYTDWSGVIKYRVNDLSTDNTGTGSANYPGFGNPTPRAGYVEDVYQRTLFATQEGPAYSWRVNYSSALTNAGVQTVDLDTAGVTPAYDRSLDLTGVLFASQPTLGAYTASPLAVAPMMSGQMDKKPNSEERYQVSDLTGALAPLAVIYDTAHVLGGAETEMAAHLFVDPSGKYAENTTLVGNSWNNPIHSLSDVLYLIQNDLTARLGRNDPFKNVRHIVVHVKEGTISNNGAYTSGHVRNNTLLIPGTLTNEHTHDSITLEIRGGYPQYLMGLDISARNPMKYPSIIDGDVIGDYEYNTAHLMTFDGSSHVVIDGFQLRNANATSRKRLEDAVVNQNGAGFLIENTSDVVIKNCLVANCQAEVGAAVYAYNAEVRFENCIFHNNASTQQIGLATNMPSIIYSAGTSALTFDHCDVLRNVGYAAWLNGAGTSQTWTNSIFYANLNQPVDDTNDDNTNGNLHYAMALPAFGGTLSGVNGSYCQFDGKSQTSVGSKFTEGSLFTLSYIFDGGANSKYPRFINPTKNAGVSPSGDITYYGRATSFEPHNTNPMVNAANTGGVPHPTGNTNSCWGTDMSTVTNRDYGGLPDIGAIENHEAEKLIDGENAYTDGQGFYGRRLYVRDYRQGNGTVDYTKGGDGSSWEHAINGNAYYHEASGTFMGSSRTGTASWTETSIGQDTIIGDQTKFTTSSLQNPTFYIIESRQFTGKYIKVAGNGTFSLTSNQKEATPFVLIGSTSAAAIYDMEIDKYVWLASGKLTLTATASQWNMDQNNGVIRQGSNYLYVADANATAPTIVTKVSGNNHKWWFRPVTFRSTGEPITTTHTNEPVKGINGLQYAVNCQSIQFEKDSIRREVWVGAGVYSKDNETEKTGHFDIDNNVTGMSNAVASTADESCFIIRDGVDVLGAFPKVGNPGIDQRQALVSQYVKVQGGYDPAMYETILEPLTPLSTSTMANTRRVLGQPHKYHSKKGDMAAHPYAGATWDGFTIRNGYLDSRRVTNARSWGGAGATVYKNVTLRNCIVTHCVNYAPAGKAANGEFRGGGILVCGGTVEQCYIINNEMRGTSGEANLTRSKSTGIAYGAGIYLYSGTVYNCVMANNLCHANIADGAGVFIDDVVEFFNNTVVNNSSVHNTRGVGGISFWSDVKSQVVVYNSISYGNIGYKPKYNTWTKSGGNQDLAFQDGGNVDIFNCITSDITDKAGTTSGYLHFHNCRSIDGSYFTNNLFVVDPGAYVSLNDQVTTTPTGGAPNTINLRLKDNSMAINMGEVNPDINGVIYDLEEFTDMDYTERVKDCAIDVGAYEYNGAYAITPDVTTVPGQAIFYVTPWGHGVASAANPENAACAAKLQKVLDAAGRYKFEHPEKQTIVKVACEASGSVDPTADYHRPTWLGGYTIFPWNETKQQEDTIYVDPSFDVLIANQRYLTSLQITSNGNSLANISFTAPTAKDQLYKVIGSTPTIQAGSTLTFNLTFPQNPNSQPLVASVWMDTKGKKVFDEQLTLVGTTNATNNDLHTFTVDIPASALNGASRLRLRLDTASVIPSNADEGFLSTVYDIPVTVAGGKGSSAFEYYATRSTDPTNQDVRIWSIMVPRGVEVWGGYTDAYTSNDDNGFHLNESGTVTDRRNVTANPTYFDATYTNKIEKTQATTYHVVTFTDRLFDANGYPYLAGDDISEQYGSYDITAVYDKESSFRHISENASVTDRAVLDGIFLSGGRADAPSASIENSKAPVTIHQFGGAAVVEPYAHVRNCIVENNTATYGGAFALKENALVSGCLIRNNTATKGAGIYVFEDGTRLGESINFDVDTITSRAGKGEKMDARMARVFLSTIVRNKAQQGGGLWFTSGDANVRVNSSVLWQNTAIDQANVAGAYSPDKPASDQTPVVEYYPFAYSAVQNLRLAGTNNLSLQPFNKNGARFSQHENDDVMAQENDGDYSDFGYFGLTSLSSMVRTGMSLVEFDSLRPIYQLAAADFMALDRKANAENAPARSYVEIGARALLKPFVSKQLMLRVYVARPEDIDADAATAMKLITDAEPGSPKEYYSQEGSSFAYPFQSLQDALDYIYLMRSVKEIQPGHTYIDTYQANNLPFEVMIAAGTYYPTRDLTGHYGESLGNTFAIPEGVSLYGGFDLGGESDTWYGRYATEPDSRTQFNSSIHNGTTDVYSTETFLTPLPLQKETITVDTKNYYMMQFPADTMLVHREQIDVNKNHIIEPWEFKHQTVLSGDATSAAGKGVYHVVTICPDEKVVGILPDPQYYLSDAMKTHPEGYDPNEMGQYIHFNGITFQGGRAHTYTSELDEIGKYNYYHGGAVLIDGNRYNNNYNDSLYALQDGTWERYDTEYKHAGHTNAVGYRDAPVSFASCRFFDNEAGYGGAISANMEVELFQSSFEKNLASYFDDQVSNADNTAKIEVNYAGQGGAVFSTYHLTAYNTLFANNEARDLEHTDMASVTYYSYRNHASGGSRKLSGAGGAIYSGVHGQLHLFNCDVVRNMANHFPAIFTMNPNIYTSAWDNGTDVSSIEYNQIASTVFWGNEVNAPSLANPNNASKRFAAQMVINYGAADRTTYDLAAHYPQNQDELDDAAHATNLTGKRFVEMLHYCAYEAGRGITPNNTHDFRLVNTNVSHHTLYQFSHIKDTTTTEPNDYFPYQNSNIAISSVNEALDGPAFMLPSTEAGIEGYMEAADWSPSRINFLTDNGNSRLLQTINTVDGQKVAAFVKRDGKFVGNGSYVLSRYYPNYPNYNRNLPLGDEHYMTIDGTSQREMYRISLDPNPTHGLSYIDIGVYEYIHVPLEPEEDDEVDILWVSNYEKLENGLPNGRTWDTPTSDLQRAIETLLASRNGHRKEIRICDGTYSPIYTIDGKLSFYIDSEFLNQAATGGVTQETATGQGIRSLTIKGGYSREYRNQYDVELYPVVLRQQNTIAPSEKYDHLIYINDATQRYHATGTEAYVDGNQHGWTNGNHTGVHTFPIQIDGVTLINDQARSAAEGTAIYYRNPAFDTNGLASASGSTLATSTTEAMVTTSLEGPKQEHTFDTVTNPHKLIISKTTVLGSGAKDHSKGASAVYVAPAGGNTLIYNSLFHSNYGNPLVAANAKLVNNTIALNEGLVQLTNHTSTEATKDSTSCMFNNILWRNNPTTQDAAQASTFGPQLAMEGLTANGNDFVHTDKGDIFAYNAYTGGDAVDINYGTGTTIDANHNNVGLVNLNTDVTYGPNFHDPLNADVMKRDFHINPSMRILNKGSNALYGDTALAVNNHVYDIAWEVTKRYDIVSASRIMAGTIDLGAYEYQYDLNRVLYVDPNKAVSGDGLSWENALGFGNIQNAIDLAGVAYSNLHKSAFVFVKASNKEDGHTTETLTLRNGVQVYGSVISDYGVECPYKGGVGNVRTYNDTVLNAYVGDVLMYGRYGIISPQEGHTRIAGINTNGTAFTVTKLSDNSANPALKPTIIDGFEVMPVNDAAANITEPVIRIAPFIADGQEATGNVQIGMRNIAVHGYNATSCNVAEVNNALLYSTLFHHNTVPADKAVMKVGVHGYLLNATIEGKTIGADGTYALHGGAVTRNDSICANTEAENESHVLCSLVNFDYTDQSGAHKDMQTIRTLSGYCYAMEDENMNYQLTERSPFIDNYHSVVPAVIPQQLQTIASAFQRHYDEDLVDYINGEIAASYNAGGIGSDTLRVWEGKMLFADRDLLGNYRWQPDFKENPACDDCNNNGLTYNIIDRGAFETWKVEKDHFVVYPNYPHPGTCEYIMAGKSLIIDPVDIEGDATASAHVPGFVLLQDGASLYGNGREMHIAFAGIERTVKNGGDLMVTTPWDQDLTYRGLDTNKQRNAVTGLFVVGYESNGALMTIERDRTFPVYEYDATARADWQYRIAPQDSKCWKPITSPILPACQGVYTRITSTDTKVAAGANITVRCMGKGANMKDFIYTELVEPGHLAHTGKSVTLYRHDDATSTNGGGDFTDSKNAGWNFVGYPYLISRYHPYTKANVTAEDEVLAILNPGKASGEYASFLADPHPYAMDRPKTLWLYYDGLKRPDGTAVDGTGGFYSVPSWEKESAAWHLADNEEPLLKVTEAYFVQTNTLHETEELVFYRPTFRSHYGGPASAPARYYVMTEDEAQNWENEHNTESGAQYETMPYEKIVYKDQIYIIRRDADGNIITAYDVMGRQLK